MDWRLWIESWNVHHSSNENLISLCGIEPMISISVHPLVTQTSGQVPKQYCRQNSTNRTIWVKNPDASLSWGQRSCKIERGGRSSAMQDADPRAKRTYHMSRIWPGHKVCGQRIWAGHATRVHFTGHKYHSSLWEGNSTPTHGPRQHKLQREKTRRLKGETTKMKNWVLFLWIQR